MHQIGSNLERGCSVGKEVFWITVQEKGWQGGENWEDKCENVSGIFRVYFLLESWSTTLDLESVPVYIWLSPPLYSRFYLAPSHVFLASKLGVCFENLPKPLPERQHLEHLRSAWLSLKKMPRKTGRTSLKDVSEVWGNPPLNFRKKISHSHIGEEEEIEEFEVNPDSFCVGMGVEGDEGGSNKHSLLLWIITKHEMLECKFNLVSWSLKIAVWKLEKNDLLKIPILPYSVLSSYLFCLSSVQFSEMKPTQRLYPLLNLFIA